MTGKESSNPPDGSGKNKISSVDTAERSNLFGYDCLVTEYGILKENHETLNKDYKILEETFKLEKEVSEALKVNHQKETKELETELDRLGKDLAIEKGEKEVLKKEMERIEAEKKAMIYELENKYLELGEKFVTVEKECSYVKSLYDAEMLTDLEGNNEALKKEVIEVDDHNVNNAITDLIVILDESDAESDNAARNSNNVSQRPVDLKQEQQFDVPNSSKGNHLPSLPSSLSSDEFVIKRGSYKRPRV